MSWLARALLRDALALSFVGIPVYVMCAPAWASPALVLAFLAWIFVSRWMRVPLALRDLAGFQKRTSAVLRLVPGGGWLERLRDAVTLQLEGRVDEARAAFARLESSEHGAAANWISRIARLDGLVTLRRWEELAREPVDLDPADRHLMQVGCRIAVARGLAESGRTAEAAALAGRILAGLEAAGLQFFPMFLRVLLVPVLVPIAALSGDAEALEAVLDSWAYRRQAAYAAFWRARCALVRNERERAVEHWRRARELARGVAPLDWGWDTAWFDAALAGAEPAVRAAGDAETSVAIRRVTERIDELPAFGGVLGLQPVSWAFVLCIVAMFCASPLSTIQYIQGATAREISFLEEPHRVLSAAFVHRDWSHVAGNSVALLMMAPVIERSLGAARMVVLLLGGELLVELAIWPIDRAMPIGRAPFVAGASECVSIVVALILVWVLRDIARGRFHRGLLLMLVAGNFVGLLPERAATIHAGGLVLGLIAGVVVRDREGEPAGRLVVAGAVALAALAGLAVFRTVTYPVDESSRGYQAFFVEHAHPRLGLAVRLPADAGSSLEVYPDGLGAATVYWGFSGMATKSTTVTSVDGLFRQIAPKMGMQTAKDGEDIYHWAHHGGRYYEYRVRPVTGGLHWTGFRCYPEEEVAGRWVRQQVVKSLRFPPGYKVPP